MALARQEHEPAVARLLRVVVARGGVGHVLVAEVLDLGQALRVDARAVEALDAARRVVVADAALGQEPVWKSTSASGARVDGVEDERAVNFDFHTDRNGQSGLSRFRTPPAFAAQNRNRDHPRPRLTETSRVDGVRRAIEASTLSH